MRELSIQARSQPYASAPPARELLEQPSALSAALQQVNPLRGTSIVQARGRDLPEIGGRGRAAFPTDLFTISGATVREPIHHPQPRGFANIGIPLAPMSHSVPVTSPPNIEHVDPAQRALDDLMDKAKKLKEANEIYKSKVGRPGLCVGVGATLAISAAAGLALLSPWIALGVGIATVVSLCISCCVTSARHKRAKAETDLDGNKGRYKAALEAIRVDEGMMQRIKNSDPLHKQWRAAKKLATL